MFVKLNKKIMAVIFLFMVSFALGSMAPPARALNIAIIPVDYYPPENELLATGFFTTVTSLGYDATPSLTTLLNYDAVLVYTNRVPSNPSAKGDVLGDYVDAGGGVVVATYGFSADWALGGKIMTSGYAPLVKAGIGDVSGSLTAVVPGDPIFSDVNLTTLSYFHNFNFAHPGLDSGSTLLATDGTYNMIARNSNGRVIGFNLFPGTEYNGNNDDFYRLLGNSLVSVAGGSIAPVPGSLVLLGSGILVLAGLRRKK